MDLSQLSDEDLRKLANNDYTKLSDDAKTMFKQPASEAPATADTNPSGTPTVPQAQPAGPVSPSMLSQAGDFAMENIVTPAVGVAQTAAQYGMANPLLTGGAALGAAKYGAIKNLAQQGINTFQTNNLLKMADAIRKGERFGQDMTGLKQVFEQQQQQQAQKMAAQQAAQNQPGIIQRATDMASKVRQAAAQRIAGLAPAAVPAAVAAGGAAATSMAGNQMAAMTPEQRKAYYDSMMMGAMSGDAGLAAAIMNRGQ